MTGTSQLILEVFVCTACGFLTACTCMQITFLQEGDTDDATMAFYASLGADDPTIVNIAPPWPEGGNSDESAESGDSLSGGEDSEGEPQLL